MSLESEISRLLDMMPASGRMLTKIVSKPQQSKVIDTPFPMPWNRDNRPIYINFDLWRRLSQSQRDLLILRAASILTGIKWFKPDVYQGITLAGLAGVAVELIQGDAVGMIVAGGLTAIAANQIWRSNRSIQRELDADEAAIKVALRRGYTEVEAARSLLSAIEAVAELEGRPSLNFTELIRCQNLRAIAKISPVSVPETVKNSDL
ncbi:MAG: DUF3318 domain-containing protein [Hydrococcus sp. C42_A2020_068]|uniref:DUF3318 domain-containing protein n=1 Tax=Pleurocapsa sp. PCC 7327 TaxID=118163 RepID=UPI00029FBC95|nr:DUF3318 domain-containing protein [Pleurocapsa sp. PCC 7327]AFY78297.1 Protein of unknown function (DUF3318) [Pleurocapsa sp. PCC 7327]MBF2020354.1 DUF3318 domain-containing protein [Hydrococcus sp. C42_A2020_068]